MRVQLKLVEWRPFFIEKLVYESWNVQIARLLCAWLTGRRATFIHACRLYVFVPMNQTCLARAELVPPPAWAAFIQLIYYSTCISPSEGKFSKISNGQRGISFWRARQLSVQPFDFLSAFAPVSSSVLPVYNTDVMEYAWERRLAIVQPDIWYLEADSTRKNHQKSGRLT
ncbi:hypothetical protein TSPI_06275 [Trichinella spiralis]|uniref:Uncharacterized protein n=1 Tax=Trichinella spiralis TaxID=6334 RepID=A0ABR3KY83_TRISP